MTSAEIYKLRTQRNPILYAAALLVGVLIPSIALVWYTPKETSAYSDAFTATFSILSVLLAIEFGGWLLGTEYCQGTVKRLLTAEPRRLRALATKGAVGAAAMSIVLVAAAALGAVAARVVGSMNDVTVPWNARVLLDVGVTSLIAAAVAYSLSAITRSHSFAKVGTLALIFIVEPLLNLVPRVGDYTIGSALDSLSQWITGEPSDPVAVLSTTTATFTVAVWLTGFLTLGAVLFARRDV